ncbi:MAG: hypothetical protein HYX66_08360 [Ignavibacteria bacterium]|nr:hypothetical protein [Ignavibacteria bacterium]
MRTRDRAEVNIEPALKPDESLYFLSLSAWCPYDDNVALVTAEVRYVNPQGIAKTGRQLFTYNVITQKSERITPTQFGDSTIFPDDIQWKPFSSPNNDTLVFNSGSYSSLEPRKMRPWLYLVQSDSIVVATTGTKRWWASNGNVFEYRRNIYPDELSVNGKTINIPIGTLQRMSWSPSGKFFLISSDLDNRPPCGSSEVWIYEASQESFDKPRHVVNLVSKYCLFSSWGTQASFLTDSTIIMSFHNYGDDKAYLYEVSFYGNIVKQVTY